MGGYIFIDREDEQSKQQMAELKAQNTEMLNILRQLNGGSPSVGAVNP